MDSVAQQCERAEDSKLHDFASKIGEMDIQLKRILTVILNDKLELSGFSKKKRYAVMAWPDTKKTASTGNFACGST